MSENQQPTRPPSGFYIPFLRLDGGLFIVLAFCLLTLRPLLLNAGLPNGPDVLYHTYRTAEMARSWQHGIFVPRWAEGMYYGYGSPVFHYYASLTYYAGAGLMLGLNITALDALRLLIVVATFLSAVGMYSFMKQQGGRLAGILAALAYVYSPYVLYTEPYGRGAYPEMLAFALFPWVMLVFGRLIRTGRGRDIALAAFLHALLIICHNLMALVLTTLLAGWLLWNLAAAWIKESVRRRRETSEMAAISLDNQFDVSTPYQAASTFYSVLRSQYSALYLKAFAALLIGAGLTAYFWLPVVLEAGEVQLQNLTAVAELDYKNGFVPFLSLLAFPPTMDTGAVNGLLHVLSLGVAQWALALVGFIGVLALFMYTAETRRNRPPALRQGLYFALMAALMIFLITPTSAGIWENFRLLSYLQFPWRFLGPVAFCLAFLVGLNALWIKRLAHEWRNGIMAGMVAALLVLSAPMLTVPEWLNTEVDASIEGYLQAELDLRQSGTTYTNEYRPRTVFTPPGATPELIADLSDGYPVNRAHVPEGVTAEHVSNNPENYEWRTTSAAPFTMEVLTFYWAGWTAEIDGQHVPITPSPEHGLITFPVPEGYHTVKVYLELTPARLLGNLISAITLVMLLAIIALVNPAPSSLPLNSAEAAVTGSDVLPWRGLGIAALITIGLMVLLLATGVSSLSTPYGEVPAQNRVDFQIGDDTKLIGYDLNSTTFYPGDTVHLKLYWLPLQMGEVNFSTFIHIAQPDTPPVAQADKLHPGGRAMKEWWSPVGYIFDDYAIKLPDTVASGEYHIYAGFYTCELMPADNCGNGFRPEVKDAAGNDIGDKIPVAVITLQ